MSSENLEIIRSEYQAGANAFERGLYRQSVQHLEKASALVNRNSRLGGEIQIWLVTAYQAAGQQSEAIALCQQLSRHPDIDTRKQGRRLLFILQAPKLSSRPEWLVQIPDLGAITDDASGDLKSTKYAPSVKRPARKRPEPEPEPIDLSQVNTQDNRFIWVALGAIALSLGGLFWFSQF